ncbi:hypothetical protein MKX01_009286 [Papaver californicum]|nr:hypothetical protein MKX01_009286 [Papaver californicum]
MAQTHKLCVENELKNCSADQFYRFMMNEMTTLPQVLPHMYKSFEILAGDGKSVGTVRLAKIVIGTFPEAIVKEKIVAVDDESRTVTISIIGGEILQMYPKFEYTLTVTPVVTQGREQSCLLKYSAEYEKANEAVPHPKENLELGTSIYEAFAMHLASKA